MTQEAASFVIWKPERDGHAPPNWREGMKWGVGNLPPKDRHSDPSWGVDYVYTVPAEALNSPNDDAAAEQKIGRVEIVVGSKRQREVVSLNELARLIKGGAAIYGITLAPEKDVFVELLADVLDAWGISAWNVSRIRSTTEHSWQDKAAIELLRQRFEQMKGAR